MKHAQTPDGGNKISECVCICIPQPSFVNLLLWLCHRFVFRLYPRSIPMISPLCLHPHYFRNQIHIFFVLQRHDSKNWTIASPCSWSKLIFFPFRWHKKSTFSFGLKVQEHFTVVEYWFNLLKPECGDGRKCFGNQYQRHHSWYFDESTEYFFDKSLWIIILIKDHQKQIKLMNSWLLIII